MAKLLMLAAAVGFMVCTVPSVAAVLYDNGGTDTSLNSRPINLGNFTTDSFTLLQTSNLTSIIFQSLDYPDTTITSVSWLISPIVDLGLTPTMTLVVSNYLFTQQNGYHVDSNIFSIGNQTLAAGKYYLSLEDAVTSTGSSAYWAESGGQSAAFENGFPYEISESFQVIGNPVEAPTVPEPATWSMIILGFGIVGAGLRQGRQIVMRLRVRPNDNVFAG